MAAREDTADSNSCVFTWWLQAQSACEGPAPVKRRPMEVKVQTGVKMQRCISNADRNTTGNVSHFSKKDFAAPTPTDSSLPYRHWLMERQGFWNCIPSEAQLYQG